MTDQEADAVEGVYADLLLGQGYSQTGATWRRADLPHRRVNRPLERI